MTKQSGQLAGAPKVDKKAERKSERTDSPLSGLFAEENEFDRRALWRIGSWGAAAVGAVTVAVMSNQWSLGVRREQLAAADLARQAQQIQSVAKESQNETRRLASAIETLNSDRDRLFSRVTVIEQGLDSVTGALARQTTATPSVSAGPQAAAAQASIAPAGTPQPPQQSAAMQSPASAPVLAPVATTTAASTAPDKRADAGKSDASGTAAMAGIAGPANPGPATTATTSPNPASSATAASLMSKSIMGPPDPAAPKLIEAAKAADARLSDIKPAEAKAADIKMAEARVEAKADNKGPDTAPAAASEVVASANATDEPLAELGSVAVKRTDFAVDLGTANSLGGLRALWRGVRHVNAELGALNPIVVIREGRTGLGMQLHLAAGPLQDAAAAARICAVLAETRRACETTVYDGQRLAMKADEAQSLPTIRASDSKSDAKAEASPDDKADAKADGKVEAKIEGKSEGKTEGKTDPRSAASHRGWSRHAKKEEPAPPPPPPQPTSTFSSLFGRK